MWWQGARQLSQGGDNVSTIIHGSVSEDQGLGFQCVPGPGPGARNPTGREQAGPCPQELRAQGFPNGAKEPPFLKLLPGATTVLAASSKP